MNMRKIIKKMLLWGLGVSSLWIYLAGLTLQAQIFDPGNTLILNTLREISSKHHLGLEEQRRQTAQMVQQLRQFYNTYTMLRNDIEFSRSLYRDFKAIDDMDFTRSYLVSNFIVNGDRLNYWFPTTTGEVTRAVSSTQNLLNNANQLKSTYESFSLSASDEEMPADAALRRHNAIAGQEAFSKALFEYALKCQVLAKSYDSMAVELQEQVLQQQNQYKPAERTQLLMEAVKLREMSSSYYQKYLELSEKAHQNELNMFDEKANLLRSKMDWDILKQRVNRISRIRYGFFDITPVSPEL